MNGEIADRHFLFFADRFFQRICQLNEGDTERFLSSAVFRADQTKG